MRRYLISYEFNDGEDQETGGEMLIKQYESGRVDNRPETYEVYSWTLMIQNGIGHSVVIETIQLIKQTKRWVKKENFEEFRKRKTVKSPIEIKAWLFKT